uniref:Uncharacterized protein n=1 Tax=Parascaris equorum TaxID=6256 RepID=A0A914RKN3_PAREQ
MGLPVGYIMEEDFAANCLNMTSKGKLYRRADVLLGKCDDTPTVVEAVQFHGVHFTKNDALVKEIAYLYKSSSLAELIKNSNLACKHLQVSIVLFYGFCFSAFSTTTIEDYISIYTRRK